MSNQTALSRATAERDKAATLDLLGKACRIDDLPTRVSEQEAILAVYDRYVGHVLRGNWSAFDGIRYGAYFRTIAKNELTKEKMLISTSELFEQEGYDGDDDGYANPHEPVEEPSEDDSTVQPSSLERARASMCGADREIFEYILERQSRTFTHKEIASELGIHPNTVTKAMRRIKLVWNAF